MTESLIEGMRDSCISVASLDKISATIAGTFDATAPAVGIAATVDGHTFDASVPFSAIEAIAAARSPVSSAPVAPTATSDRQRG